MTYPNLYHLKYFIDAVELGSISKAASKNLVSHPAISQAIRTLESQYELDLLVHKKKSFEVTDTGLAFVLKAKELLEAMENLGTSELSDEIIGSVTIGISRSLTNAFLIPLLDKLKKDFPKINLAIKFGTTSELIEGALQGKVHLAITIGNTPMPGLKQLMLHRGNFILIHGSKEKMTKKDKFSFILTEPRYETELLKKCFQQKFKTRPDIQHVVESWDVIGDLVSKRIGVGLVPDILIHSKNNKEISQLPVDWFKCPYEIYIHSLKSATEENRAKSLVLSLVSEIIH